MHSRKSLLFNNTDIWIKKNRDPDFHVMMRSWLHRITCASGFMYSPYFGWEVQKKIGLYCNDRLVCGYINGPQADRIRKDFLEVFKKDFDLSITCEANLKTVNFQDYI